MLFWHWWHWENNVVDITTGASRTAQREGSWDISLVEQATQLMIVGVVTPTGNATGSVWRIVALVLAGMLSVVVMENFMWWLTPGMMTLWTRNLALFAMLWSRTGPCGLCSRGTWLFSWSRSWSWTALRPLMLEEWMCTLLMEHASQFSL